MSILGTTFLDEIIGKNRIDSPAKILDKLRQKIKKALNQSGKNEEQKDGMDMSLCIFDLHEMILQFSGAYNPMYIIRNNELIILAADRQPIAIHLIEKDFTNHTVELKKNDNIYLFSDGYADQTGGPENRKYLNKNFKNLLIEISNFSIEIQKIKLEENLINWQGNTNQIDAILVIGIEI